MKLSQKLLNDDPYYITPPPCSSGTSTSIKTPGRDLEDRWSLDRVCDVGSWWNLQKLLKYDPYHMPPPRGSSGTSTSSKTPGGDLEDRWSLDRVSAFSKFFRNLLILKDSRERLWGQVESWRVSDVGYWWNFHRNFLRIIPIIWHQLLVHQESLQVHQEPQFSPRLQEETWRTMEFWWVSGVGSWWNLTWSHLLVHIQHACPIKDSTDSRWLQKDTWRKGGV